MSATSDYRLQSYERCTGTLKQLAATFADLNKVDRKDCPQLSTEPKPTSPAAAGGPNATERALATLWPHIGRFQILNLSTEEREALADARDKVSQHDDPDEFEPRRRWWHDDAPLHWDPKYA